MYTNDYFLFSISNLERGKISAQWDLRFGDFKCIRFQDRVDVKSGKLLPSPPRTAAYVDNSTSERSRVRLAVAWELETPPDATWLVGAAAVECGSVAER